MTITISSANLISTSFLSYHPQKPENGMGQFVVVVGVLFLSMISGDHEAKFIVGKQVVSALVAARVVQH